MKKTLGLKPLSFERLHAGGNNRVYKVSCDTGEVFVAKAYHKNPMDTRDRLKSEYEGTLFLWENDVKNIPKPILAHRPGHFALFEFVHGQKLPTHEIKNDHIRIAGRFLSELKNLSQRPGAISLPPASEACYSLVMVVESVKARFERLKNLAVKDPWDKKMLAFLHDEFDPVFNEKINTGENILNKKNIQSDGEINLRQRTLSPSDFGFHNALIKDDGEIVFLDFEYFGWDDPVKMISDFIFHPAMNLSKELAGFFLNTVNPVFSADAQFRTRLEALFPLFGLKWALIILNEFLPDQMARRQFANVKVLDQNQLREGQLNKARSMLGKVKNGNEILVSSAHGS